MHFSAYHTWALLPVLASAAAVSLHPRLDDPSHPAEAAIDTSILQSLQIDHNSAQASFIVPCSNCLGTEGAYTNQSFLFNFQAFPSEKPCGESNVTLNGIPLSPQWESTGVHAQGLASVPSSGHELNLFLRSDCLYPLDSEGPSAPGATQLLTLTIEKVDEQAIQSLSGFTLSFKQAPTPELLRLSIVPDFEARDPPHADTWRNPPANLRLVPIPEDSDSRDNRELSIEEHIIDLKRLEAQAKLLEDLIEEKKQFLKSYFKEGGKGLKKEIKECDSFGCVVKAIVRKVHSAAHIIYLKFKHHYHHEAYMNTWSAAGGQAPTKMAASDLPQSPEACHCHDGKPSARPVPYKGTEPPLSEKPPIPDSVNPHTVEPQWREAKSPSPLAILLKTLLAITGLAFLFGFLRRRCMSLRKRAERAAERERRTAERLYRRDARRQAWRDWWYGIRRGTPGRRTGDYEEKRTLILQQEGVLEEAMQDEIRQLRIQEEIRQLRNTRDAVDDLVRAEEGRSVYPPTYRSASSSSSSTLPGGFSHIPTPITIPHATSCRFPSPRPNHHDDLDDHPPSPLSRTSSLPDYKTEASSEPPGYDTDDEMAHDGFSDYSPSMGTQGSAWTPGSSIPDISPRPSIETARTFL